MLLKTLQQDLDDLSRSPHLLARRARLLLDMAAAERRPHPGASTGDRAEKYRALEALLVSYGATGPQGMAAGTSLLQGASCSSTGASSSGLVDTSSLPPESAAARDEDRRWVLRHWHGLRCFLVVPLFGADEEQLVGADSQASMDSVEITGEIMVRRDGAWRPATDVEREQVQHRDMLEREMEEAQDADDALKWEALQETRKSEAAQAWDRHALQAAMAEPPLRKKMPLCFRLRDGEGHVVAEGGCPVEALPAQVRYTETWLEEDDRAPGALDEEEPNVGSVEFDELVVQSSQQLPGQESWQIPPHIQGQEDSVVAAYLAMYLDGSIPDEIIEDRFGPATLGLFRTRRQKDVQLVDDPIAWHVFRRWTRGDLTDDDILEEYGPTFLDRLRAEQGLQGGATPEGLATAEAGEDRLPDGVGSAQRKEGAGNSEDKADSTATTLIDTREGMTAGFGEEGFNIVTARAAAASGVDDNVNRGPNVNMVPFMGAADLAATSLADPDGAANSVAAEDAFVKAAAGTSATAEPRVAADAPTVGLGAVPGLPRGQVEASSATSTLASAGSWRDGGWTSVLQAFSEAGEGASEELQSAAEDIMAAVARGLEESDDEFRAPQSSWTGPSSVPIGGLLGLLIYVNGFSLGVCGGA